MESALNPPPVPSLSTAKFLPADSVATSPNDTAPPENAPKPLLVDVEEEPHA
jgi:hypothetical protein